MPYQPSSRHKPSTDAVLKGNINIRDFLRSCFRIVRPILHKKNLISNLNSGNVGLSLGYPTADTPLCGQFTTFGKVIICLLMIRGRHRGMPSQIDRAVMLPSDLLAHDVRARPGDTQQRSTPAERLKGMKRFNTN